MKAKEFVLSMPFLLSFYIPLLFATLSSLFSFSLPPFSSLFLPSLSRIPSSSLFLLLISKRFIIMMHVFIFFHTLPFNSCEKEEGKERKSNETRRKKKEDGMEEKSAFLHLHPSDFVQPFNFFSMHETEFHQVDIFCLGSNFQKKTYSCLLDLFILSLQSEKF